ncbi:hypothetical protein Bhyg_10086 [Pseudolycoriella hygida]|uniref:Uncharacterized protein n=1 Tax=Pseudolycoriella hygida TaxID=35572 RepID=A0A9Q0MSV3_9DIPT|nr:hypothetical protein Bhyg_10086 [Pseudolycoriella hygida]
MPRKIYSIDCTWLIGHGNDINNLVTVDEITKNALPKSINIDDITGTDRAVLFIKNAQTALDHDDDCQLKINAGPRNSLSQVTIVCDSDVIELFTGTYEEYIQTYRGELLDEFDGNKSYLFEIKLKKDTNSLSLKFITLVDQLWIYGVHMYLTEKPINIFQPTVNIGNVSDYLSDSKRDLSENASKCKEFIQMHMNANKSSGPPNMAALMSFINGKVEDKFSQIDVNATEEIVASTKIENGENSEQKTCANLTMDSLGLESSIDLVRTYFDSKFRDIEQKLLNKIDERFSELEKKQDEKFSQLLALLQK